jgi:hypothetical protein
MILFHLVNARAWILFIRTIYMYVCPKLEGFVRIVMLFLLGNLIIKYVLIVME